VQAIDQHLKTFFASPQPDVRRIFHGRGQCFPGLEHLCLDWFAPVVLISAYEPVSDPAALVDVICSADQHGQVATILLQKRFETGSPTEALFGSAPRKVVVTEGDLRFEVQPGQRRNSGLFLDMSVLRERVRQEAKECNVLNLFAYTCAFSVAALAGGAQSVTNVDMSKNSLAWGARNHELNGQDAALVKYIPHNLFRSWGRIKQFGRYDLVIIDPPTRQRGSFDVEKNYGSVLKRLPGLCNPNAKVIATLNSPFQPVDYLLELFARRVPGAELIEQLSAAPEFVDKHPERALKICEFAMPA